MLARYQWQQGMPVGTAAAATKNIFVLTAAGPYKVAALNQVRHFTLLSGGPCSTGVILFDGNLNMKMTPLSAAFLCRRYYILTEGNIGRSLALNFAGLTAAPLMAYDCPCVYKPCERRD